MTHRELGLRSRITRGLAVGLSVLTAALFLAFFGPTPRAVSAEPESQGGTGEFLLVPPKDRSAELSSLRSIRINRQRFLYFVGSSRQPLNEVLDHYAEQLGGEDSVLRSHGDNFGLVVGSGPSPVFRPSLVAHGLELSAALPGGLFHSVMAFAGSRGTTFLHLFPDPALSFEGFLTDSGGDSPGSDLPGIGRPPGSQRLFEIEQPGAIPSRTLIYRTSQKPALARQSFRDRLLQRGWIANPEISTGVAGALLHFTRHQGREECYVASLAEQEGALIALIYRGDRLQEGL